MSGSNLVMYKEHKELLQLGNRKKQTTVCKWCCYKKTKNTKKPQWNKKIIPTVTEETDETPTPPLKTHRSPNTSALSDAWRLPQIYQHSCSHYVDLFRYGALITWKLNDLSAFNFLRKHLQQAAEKQKHFSLITSENLRERQNLLSGCHNIRLIYVAKEIMGWDLRKKRVTGRGFSSVFPKDTKTTQSLPPSSRERVTKRRAKVSKGKKQEREKYA